MRSVTSCRKAPLLLAMLALSGLATKATAVTLNFNAQLVSATCTFSLDRTTLNLGSISLAQLRTGILQETQPFTLIVQDCNGTEVTLRPMVHVSGDGQSLGGRWVFRSNESTAVGVGVMLVRKDAPPSPSDTEVSNGDDIALAGMGHNPPNQSIRFYAGMSCASTGCSSGQPVAGTVTARILFNLTYR